MTYEEIAQVYPEEAAARKADKFGYAASCNRRPGPWQEGGISPQSPSGHLKDEGSHCSHPATATRAVSRTLTSAC